MEVMLSDRMRRFICRFIFLGGCLLPTLLVVRWILFPTTPTEWSRRIQQQLGVSVSVGRVEVSSPQQTEFFDINIGRHEFASSVAIDQATVSSTTTGRIIHIRNAAGSPRAVWKCLNQIAADAIYLSQSSRPIVIHVDTIELVQYPAPSESSHRLTDLQINIDRFGQQLVARFGKESGNRPADDKAITIIRQVGDEHQPVWRIDLAGKKIPAWVVGEAAGQLAFLNGDCLVAGQCELFHDGDEWQAKFQGSLENIELEHVVFKNFAQSLLGKASVAIDSGSFVNGRLYELSGRFHSDQGKIGPRLLQACEGWLSAAVVAGYGAGPEDYRNLSFRFELKNHQLAVFGHRNDGRIATDEEFAPMIFVAHGRRHPISNLVGLLAFPHGSGLGLTRETESLARHLALPPSSSFESMPSVREADGDVGTETFFK